MARPDDAVACQLQLRSPGPIWAELAALPPVGERTCGARPDEVRVPIPGDAERLALPVWRQWWMSAGSLLAA